MRDVLLISNDLSIADGDFVIGDSDEQHQGLLMQTTKGDWREDATIGVGVRRYLKEEDGGDYGGLLGEIKQEFERDGMRVNKIKTQGESLTIDAVYV